MNLGGLQNKFKGTLRGKGYHLGHRPALDWIVALFCFLAFTFLGLFLTLTNRPGISELPGSESNGTATLSEALLNRVLNHYEAKNKQFNSLLENPPNLADPSL